MSNALETIKNELPDYARDIRLNLESVLTPENSPGLTPAQVWSVALSAGFALKDRELTSALLEAGGTSLNDQTVTAAKAAATIMAMNNVYYRSLHLMDDAELKKLPARLRMNVIGKPGIEKVDFELMCFAISALSGCGQCLAAHARELSKAGVTSDGLQSVLKIASVVNATQTALALRAL